MIKQAMLGAILAIGFGGIAAQAATLSLIGTGQSQVIAKNDLGLGLNGQVIDYISGDQKTNTNGLFLSGPARVTFTYLGFEAGNSNFAANLGGCAGMFVNGVSSVGDQVTTTQMMAGLVAFLFGTTAPPSAVGQIANDGVASPAVANFAIGYFRLSSTSYLALFDDIARGDRDFDDIGIRIDVAPIPLPAGGALLLGALGALAFARRRRAAA